MPVDEPRDDIAGELIRGPAIVDRNDARVHQPGHVAGFPQIRLGVVGTRDEPSVWGLDGDMPAELLVVGEIDLAKAALPQDALHPVSANSLDNGSGQCGRQ